MAAPELDPAHVLWSRRTFDLVTNGGIWGVPRSGLMFRKMGDELILVDRMPYDEAMPMGREALLEYQEADYLDIKQHFEAAGVPVRKSPALGDS